MKSHIRFAKKENLFRKEMPSEGFEPSNNHLTVRRANQLHQKCDLKLERVFMFLMFLAKNFRKPVAFPLTSEAKYTLIQDWKICHWLHAISDLILDGYPRAQLSNNELPPAKKKKGSNPGFFSFCFCHPSNVVGAKVEWMVSAGSASVLQRASGGAQCCKGGLPERPLCYVTAKQISNEWMLPRKKAAKDVRESWKKSEALHHKRHDRSKVSGVRSEGSDDICVR